MPAMHRDHDNAHYGEHRSQQSRPITASTNCAQTRNPAATRDLIENCPKTANIRVLLHRLSGDAVHSPNSSGWCGHLLLQLPARIKVSVQGWETRVCTGSAYSGPSDSLKSKWIRTYCILLCREFLCRTEPGMMYNLTKLPHTVFGKNSSWPSGGHVD